MVTQSPGYSLKRVLPPSNFSSQHNHTETSLFCHNEHRKHNYCVTICTGNISIVPQYALDITSLSQYAEETLILCLNIHMKHNYCVTICTGNLTIESQYVWETLLLCHNMHRKHNYCVTICTGNITIV